MNASTFPPIAVASGANWSPEIWCVLSQLQTEMKMPSSNHYELHELPDYVRPHLEPFYGLVRQDGERHFEFSQRRTYYSPTAEPWPSGASNFLLVENRDRFSGNIPYEVFEGADPKESYGVPKNFLQQSGAKALRINVGSGLRRDLLASPDVCEIFEAHAVSFNVKSGSSEKLPSDLKRIEFELPVFEPDYRKSTTEWMYTPESKTFFVGSASRYHVWIPDQEVDGVALLTLRPFHEAIYASRDLVDALKAIGCTGLHFSELSAA